MRRKADRVVIAVRLQSLKLANPIDEALTDGCPIAQSWPSAFLTALCNANDQCDPSAKDYIHRGKASHHVRVCPGPS
jgi:hypothetical protein